MKNQRHLRPKLCVEALVRYALYKHCAKSLKKSGKIFIMQEQKLLSSVAFRLFVVVSSHQWTLRLGPRPRPTEDLTIENDSLMFPV